MHLKKLRRAERGAKIVGVFRVKNHDFTPKKSFFFPILGEGGVPWICPWYLGKGFFHTFLCRYPGQMQIVTNKLQLDFLLICYFCILMYN